MARDIKAGPKAPPKSKGPPLPVVLSANDLLEGDVVFLAAEGWTRDPAEARVAHDAETAGAMEAEAAAAFRANRVVDPYLVPVAIDASGQVSAPYNTDGMFRGWVTVEGDLSVASHDEVFWVERLAREDEEAASS